VDIGEKEQASLLSFLRRHAGAADNTDDNPADYKEREKPSDRNH
jgi:hypothetical protein